jgi:MFS family permease
MALLNGAGCLGMLLGPMAGGIACAVFRTETDPVRGYRAAFLVAAAAASAWLIGSMAWLTRRGRSERALGGSARAAMEMDG